MPHPTLADGLPFLMDERVSLRLTGEWLTGGPVRIYFDGKLVDLIPLTGVNWIILATLILALKQSRDQSPDIAFVRTADIVEAVRHYIGKKIAPRRFQIIDELRKTLTQNLPRRDPRTDGKRKLPLHRRMIENVSRFGYRLSLPPANVELEILRRDIPHGDDWNETRSVA